MMTLAMHVVIASFRGKGNIICIYMNDHIKQYLSVIFLIKRVSWDLLDG